MRLARWTPVVAALAAVGAGCDDGAIVPPRPPVWRSSWSHPLPHGATIRGLGGWTEFDQWAVGDGGLIARYRGLGLAAVASPTTHTLHDVVAFSSTDVFMVGDAGTIVGPGLVMQTSPTSENLYSLFGFSAGNLIAVGANGTIIHNDGGGWQTVPSPTSADLYGVWVLGKGERVAVGAGGVVIASDGVSPWALVPAFTARDLNAVWADKPGDWFAVGDGGEIWQDRGAGWTPMASPRSDDFYDVFGSDSAYVWAVGDADSILFYDQVSWQPVAPSPSGHLDAVWATICAVPLSSRDARARTHCSNTYFAGAGGIATRYTLFGTHETLTSALTYADLRGIHGLAGGDVYAVGEGGAVLHYDGAWSSSSPGVPEDLNDVFVISPLDVFIVGDGGRVTWGTAGAWTSATPTAANLNGVWAQDGARVFVVGDAGTIYRFDRVAFDPESAPMADYTDVWGLANGEPIAVARGGVIVMRSAGAWSPMPDPVASDLYGVWGTSISNAYAVGAGGVILRADVGGAWQSMVSGVSDDVVAVSGRGSAVWAVTRGGAALRLDGTSWSIEASQPVAGYGGVLVRSNDRVLATANKGGILHFERRPQ